MHLQTLPIQQMWRTRLDNASRQTGRAGGLAGGIHRTGQESGNILEDLALCAGGVADDGHIDVPPEVDALHAKIGQGREPHSESLTVDKEKHTNVWHPLQPHLVNNRSRKQTEL